MKKNFLKIKFSEFKYEAGTDEAGRGALAGPVVAAAVILPENFIHKDLTDSKKLTEKKRYELRNIIIENALAWRVSFVSQYVIDKVNILNASILAMHQAIRFLPVKPEFVIVDGNRFKPIENIPHQTIVNGDEKYLAIAAASILAKTFRDDFMKTIHKNFPQFHWNKNKGYATLEHKVAIRRFGVTRYHRKSFHPNIEQLKFEF